MMTLETELVALDALKKDLSNNVGKTICIQEFSKQGKLTHQYIGEITDLYERLFLVKISSMSSSYNRSFAYNELLTNQMQYNWVEKQTDLDF